MISLDATRGADTMGSDDFMANDRSGGSEAFMVNDRSNASSDFQVNDRSAASRQFALTAKQQPMMGGSAASS